MTGRALDADQVSQTLRQSERQERALQMEVQKARREAYAPKKVAPEQDEHRDADHKHAEKPKIKNAEEAQRFLASPEMTERLKEATAHFNKNLPELNAMMAQTPIPGKTFIPLEPLKEGELQRNAGQAMTQAVATGDANGGFKIPQFEALEEWREAMMAMMTNGIPQKMPAMPKVPEMPRIPEQRGGKR